MTGNSNSITFKYNASGIRTEKTVENVTANVTTKVTTNYHLEGDKVTHEENGTDNIYYTYDALGHLASMNITSTATPSFNGEYYYIRNAQGDVIGLFDKNGTPVVSYTYDSWGKLISTTGTLASTVGVKNPYRYRGCRYDTETGLYYLQSRYYNAEWGRFINGDDAAILQATQGAVLSHNLFAYCMNNPIMNSDPSGYLAANIISAIIGGVISVLIEYITSAGLYYLTHNSSFANYSPSLWGLGMAFTAGFISGALMVSSLKAGAQATIGGVVGLISGIIDEVRNAKSQRRNIDIMYPLSTATIGVISCLISGGGLGKSYKWSRSVWYVGGKTYYTAPVTLLATRRFADSLVSFIKGSIFGQISKVL